MTKPNRANLDPQKGAISGHFIQNDATFSIFFNLTCSCYKWTNLALKISSSNSFCGNRLILTLYIKCPDQGLALKLLLTNCMNIILHNNGSRHGHSCFTYYKTPQLSNMYPAKINSLLMCFCCQFLSHNDVC